MALDNSFMLGGEITRIGSERLPDGRSFYRFRMATPIKRSQKHDFNNVIAFGDHLYDPWCDLARGARCTVLGELETIGLVFDRDCLFARSCESARTGILKDMWAQSMDETVPGKAMVYVGRFVCDYIGRGTLRIPVKGDVDVWSSRSLDSMD